MIDVQPAPPAQPSVFDATPVVSPSGALTRPGGTALHVEADPTYVLVRRVLVGTCTREEWAHPQYRRLTIARAWQRAIEAIRVEDEEFVAYSPVTLYHDWRTGEVALADISLPGQPQKLITPEGRTVLAEPADLAIGYRRQRTTYAHWAEGPLPHLQMEMEAARTPDEDRDIQYLRHQNRRLRQLVDGALSPVEWAPEANTLVDGDLVDFRLRGIFRRREYHQLISKQTGEVSGLLIGGGHVEVAPEVTAAPTTEAALDALLEAE